MNIFSSCFQLLARYGQIWLTYGRLAFQINFVHRGMLVFFLLGKVARYAIALIVMLTLRNNIDAMGQYTMDQVLVFFIIYTIIDSVAQTLFRGVYDFSWKIRDGALDFDLIKPLNPLFRSLLGSPDINDVIFLIPLLLVNVWILSTLNIVWDPQSVVWGLLLLINGLFIAAALHILVLSLGVFSTQIDGAMWLYRDVYKQTQIPVSLQRELMRWGLLFVVPVALMSSVPTEVMLGLQPSVSIPTVLVITGAFVAISLFTWKKSLEHYTSASS